MDLLTLVNAAGGPPPPPPPIFAEKTRGKKSTSSSGLVLVCEDLPKTAKRGADQGGGMLWLRNVAGHWFTAAIPGAAFAEVATTGQLELIVDSTLDPVEALIQPRNEAWAQRVALVTAFAAMAS